MRIIPKNTKVSTEFFKGVTLADMIVGFIGVLIVFLIAISSLPYRGYIAIGFGFILVFLLVRIDDESNYMFFFRIIRHFSYYRSYRKPGFEYPEMEEIEEAYDDMEQNQEIHEFAAEDMTVAEHNVFEQEIATNDFATEDVTLSGYNIFEQEITTNDFDTATPETSNDVFGDMSVLEKETENFETEPQKEIEPLHTELEESGFEVLDLDEISVEAKSIKKTTSEIIDRIDSKKKAPQSVLKNRRNKPSKVKKGDS